MDEILLIDKPLDMTSFDVCAKMRKHFKTKRVGHAGTLDPQASGVLVVMINKATKLSNFLVMDSKEYIATFRLGLSTTTQDMEGEILEEVPYQKDVSLEQLQEVLNTFIGIQKQVPSIYSAIKVNGKKLYEYARNNEEVEIPIREIEIYNIDLLSFEDDLVTIKVSCSSGTYIRSLCFDISKALNYPGVLTYLRRTQSGQFSIDQAYTLEQIQNNEYTPLTIRQALSNYPALQVDDKQLVDVKNGKIIATDINQEFIVVDQEDNVIALYHPSKDGQAKMKRGLW